LNNYSDTPTLANVEFRHFDLSIEALKTGELYIGLPGELINNKNSKETNSFNPDDLPNNIELVQKTPLPGVVSYGNGNEIWKVRVK
jgi:hypothetical protein